VVGCERESCWAFPTRAPDPASCFLASPSSLKSHRQRTAHDVTMAEESYRDYLAARVLTENKPVSCLGNVLDCTPKLPRSPTGSCLAPSMST
jgi:hypothetical protein